MPRQGSSPRCVSLRPLMLLLLLALASCAAPSGAASGDAKAVAGRMVDGRPQGLYFMTRYWSFTRTLEKAAWYFSPDGNVYQNLETGVAAADLAAHQGPRGTFAVSGLELAVTLADGKTTKCALEIDAKDPNCFMWEMGSFIPAQPIQDAKSISGSYEGGESLSGGGNRVAVAKTLELRPDGSFQWEGVSLVAGQTGDTLLYAGDSGTSTGTWEAGDYSLTFKPAGGKSLRQIAFPVDDDETPLEPDHLYIGGMLFKRLK